MSHECGTIDANFQGEEDTQILEIAMGDEDDQMSISPDFVKSQNQNTKLTFTTTYEFKPEEFGYDIWDGKTGVDVRCVLSVIYGLKWSRSPWSHNDLVF